MNEHDDDLKALLQETASGITPRGGFETIKERTMNEDRRRWILPSIAAAAVVALLVGGLGWMLRDDDPTSTRDLATAPSTTTAAPRAVPATVYYAGTTTRGNGLFAETHQVTMIGDTDFPDIEQGVQQAISGAPDDPDYRSLWPAGVTVRDIGFSGGPGDGGTINIGLTGPAADRPAGMSSDDAVLAIEAVVRTAQGIARDAETPQASAPVWFTVDGQEVESVLGVRADTFTPGRDDEVLAPVQIDSLAEGSTLPAGIVEVSGVASAFEANVLWELEDATGSRIDEGFTTADECCTLSPYSFTLDLAPGTYTIVVHDEDMSGENRPVNQDTKTIVVE